MQAYSLFSLLTFGPSILRSCKLESKGISAHVASCLYGWYISIGLGDTEDSTMWLVQERYGDYYQDVALEHFTYYNKQSQHCYICAIRKCSGICCETISLQLSLVVVGTNLISTLQCCALCGNIVCTTLLVAQNFDGG